MQIRHLSKHQRLAKVAAALAVLLAAAQAPAAPGFDAPFREHLAGIEAVSLAPGDFNEDGLLDVVVSIDAPAADLVFMRQNPDHTFSHAGSWNPADFLHKLAAGDFNGDGHLDVAGLSFGDEVQIYFGDGLGAAPGYTSQVAPPGSISIARANLNGPADGDDLVVASYSWSQLQTYLGAGGLLTPALNYATLGFPAALGIGDLDGDGFDDIVTAHDYLEVTQLLFTDGAGGIASAMSLSYAPYYSTAAAVHDVDGDGHNDVLIGSGVGTGVAVYLNSGVASYASPVYYGGAVASVNFSVLCGDVDGDTHPDLVLGGTSSYVMINTGLGAFTTGGVALPDGAHGFSEMHLRDFDGDARLDLLTLGNYGSTLVTARGNGNGTFETDLQLPAEAVERILLSDVDGDADEDLVAINASTWSLDVLPRSGSAFGAAVPQPLGEVPSGLARGDFNADGHPDFVTTTPNTGDVQMALNDGAGGMVSGFTLGTGERPVDVAVGDLDGDGLDDIVAVCGVSGETKAGDGAPAAPASATSLEGFSIFLNLGAASFAPPVFVPEAGGCPVSVAIADVTGDGHADLIGALACLNEVHVYPGLGTGAFGSPITVPAGNGPVAIGVRDLDGDSLPDLVVLCNQGWIFTVRNAGGGAFDAAIGSPTSHGANHLALGDFDGDGLTDAAALSFAGVVSVHTGAPGGVLGARQGLGTFASPRGLLANDFDGDGDLDLLVNSSDVQALQFLRNSGGGGSSAVGDGPVFAGGLLDLGRPFPNPAGAGGTRLLFNLGAARNVSVDVFDLRGRLVRRLLGGRDLEPGSHALSWDLSDDHGSRVASGVYFARVRAGDEQATRKVFVTR
jgi:hypothetical protein